MGELFAVGVCITIALGFALLFGVNFKFLAYLLYPFQLVFTFLWIRPKQFKKSKAERKKAESRIRNMILYHNGDRGEILLNEGSTMTQVELEVLNDRLPDSTYSIFND
jgi:hypothetical protein